MVARWVGGANLKLGHCPLARFLATAYQFKQTADYGIGRFIDTITQVLPPGLTPPRGPTAPL